MILLSITALAIARLNCKIRLRSQPSQLCANLNNTPIAFISLQKIKLQHTAVVYTVIVILLLFTQ